MACQKRPRDDGAIAFYCLAGVCLGVLASTMFISRYPADADAPWLMALYVYATAGAAGALSAVVLLGMVRRSREWVRRYDMLPDTLAIQRRQAEPANTQFQTTDGVQGELAPTMDLRGDLYMRLSLGAMQHKRAFLKQRPDPAKYHNEETPALRIIEGGYHRPQTPTACGVDVDPGQTEDDGKVWVTEGIANLPGENISTSIAPINPFSGSGCVKVSRPTTKISLEDWHRVEDLMSEANVIFVDADLRGDVVDTLELCMRMRDSSPETIIIWIPVKHEATAS